MITPDELPLRFSAPATNGELHERQLRFADETYQLAERALSVLPGGHHLEQAILALETANHWIGAGLAALQDETAAAAVDGVVAAAVATLPVDAEAGLAAVMEAATADDDGPVPYTVARPELPQRPLRGVVVPDTIEGLGDLDLDVTAWRTALRAAHLHPFARLLGHALAEATDAHGYIPDSAQPTVIELVEATGLDGGTVLQAVEELATAGLISRHNDGGLTRYQLRLPLAPMPPREGR